MVLQKEIQFVRDDDPWPIDMEIDAVCICASHWPYTNEIRVSPIDPTGAD